MKSYFVTGTDTGIGKTVASTLLAKGLGCNYWKPIQTGNLYDRDSDFAQRWLGPERVLPEKYSFTQPLSPHLAARAEGVRIEIADLNLPLCEGVIVEGAGGILVPLNEQNLMIDLAQRLNIPVIVVASTRLGTINHTLLTLEALRGRQLEVTGVLLNGPYAEGLEETLRVFTKVIGRISYCPEFKQNWFESGFAKLEFL